ncbi:disulfide bond formation protein DsbD [Sporosarcina sp. P3]|uniref:disulfide bond formation protein DsbD n=1 Tax=Sporosarcina TaxID=1569 RepID=UPI0009DC54B7|nr:MULTISPECIES: disulfide bond formation protein DsbD [Sporosarcina]ARF18779.1 disulfide bond formation protein DsbD [Sporosarcina ureae]PID20122.1 disulfide bond formation protein DsbD [Sporosarcina sp. P3]
MNKKAFNIIGWILLLVMGVSWIVFGYSNWYLLLLPLSYISFSISDGSIKKLGELSISQAALILFALAVSVSIVFGLIQLANFVINDKLHLTGVIKTASQIIAIIISLYPVKFTFGSVVYKVYGDSHANKT